MHYIGKEFQLFLAEICPFEISHYGGELIKSQTLLTVVHDANFSPRQIVGCSEIRKAMQKSTV